MGQAQARADDVAVTIRQGGRRPCICPKQFDTANWTVHEIVASSCGRDTIECGNYMQQWTRISP